MENKEIDFISRRYKKGRFSSDSGWQRLGIVQSSKWRIYRVAAAVAASVILSATAAIVYKEYRLDEVPQQTAPAKAVNPLVQVKVIDFENAPLPEVIKKIESVYSIKIEGIPDSPEQYVLSLHYEGTPTDLISVINDILETKMTVKEE